MTRQSLVHKLLETLVDEWGLKRVEHELNRIAASKQHAAFSDKKEPTVKKKASSPSAIQQASRADLPDDKRTKIEELARRFDRKEFLPTAADVREFLLMSGGKPQPIKDRKNSFRKVLNVLAEMPSAYLETVLKSARHSGPSQLGPLSDAISSAAATRIRTSSPPFGPKGPEGSEKKSEDDN